jgi:hypothetical protein
VAAATSHPVVVLGVLFAAVLAVAVARFPAQALVILLFLEPFHGALFLTAQNRAGVNVSPVALWKDVLIVALFLRGAYTQWREGGSWLPRRPGDGYLVAYVLFYALLAATTTHTKPAVYALGRDVEGPLLFLAILWLRPTHRQLQACLVALLAAASIMGLAAIYEHVGPRADFVTWYGAPRPAPGSSFFASAGSYRSGSFLDSPLILAFYLAGVIPFALAVSATVSARWRTLAVGAVGLCVGGLLVTLTRSAFIGAGVGTVLAIGLAVRNPGVRFSLVGMVAVVSLTVSLAAVSSGNQSFLRPKGTSQHRAALHRDFDLIVERPIGYGLGTTDAVQQRFGLTGAPGGTESTFLAKALEGGVEGLALYLIALFVTALRVLEARRDAMADHDWRSAGLASGAIGCIVAISLAGLFLGIQELVVEVVLWAVPAIALVSCETAWPAELPELRYRLPTA